MEAVVSWPPISSVRIASQSSLSGSGLPSSPGVRRNIPRTSSRSGSPARLRSLTSSRTTASIAATARRIRGNGRSQPSRREVAMIVCSVEPPRAGLAHQRERRGPQPAGASGLGDAEDHGDDDPQRDLLHEIVDGGRPVEHQVGERLFSLALHHLLMASQHLAVKRGQLHPAPARVLRTVNVGEPGRAEQEQVRRGLGERGAEAQDVRVGGEDALDVAGIGQAQPRAGGGHRDHEPVTEASAASREPLRRDPVLRGVDSGRTPQTGQGLERFMHWPLPSCYYETILIT